MRIAAIDIGTNTVQLLVADGKGETIRRVHTAERFVRLGEGVDAHGRIGPAAQDRLLRALHDHQQALQSHGAEAVVVAGTSALRDAANRAAVMEAVEQEMGWAIDLLSGPDEAAWSFAAACDACPDLTGPCLVVDVGGGSTELIAGRDPAAHRPRPPDAITDRVSLNLGCVRLTERCFDRQPPAPAAVDTAEQIIRDALSDADLAPGPAPTVVGTAGTASALALVHAGPNSTGDALHGTGAVLSHDAVRHWRDRLVRLSVDDIRALHPAAMAGRADVFPVGVLLLDCLLAHLGRPSLRVSPYELRHGLVLRHLAPT
jgi:exopolyphosphatase/guanosine-5'-triphosphate,3'-diphosphate pyrophosphatase